MLCLSCTDWSNCKGPLVYVPREHKFAQAVIFAEFILATLTLNRESKLSEDYWNWFNNCEVLLRDIHSARPDILFLLVLRLRAVQKRLNKGDKIVLSHNCIDMLL